MERLDSGLSSTKAHDKCVRAFTDLFSMEVSILVTVGYGDCEEIIMRTRV